MSEKRKSRKFARRDFLKEVAGGGALASTLATPAPAGQSNKTGSEGANQAGAGKTPAPPLAPIEFPRTFTGRNLKMIAFPLGGIGTGTISLGGRGRLRDWEIFNRPDKGNELSYAFPAIWVKVGEGKPVARVLESRLQPPYEVNSSGLGSDNAPGLPRLAEGTFTGAYPFARIAFRDPQLPVEVRLEAFNPLVPLDVDTSGWPVAILRYTIRNTANAAARVGMVWSIENPVGEQGRQAAYRQIPGLSGLYMDNPFLSSLNALKGSFVLGVVGCPRAAFPICGGGSGLGGGTGC